jgi:hypothetical protein
MLENRATVIQQRLSFRRCGSLQKSVRGSWLESASKATNLPKFRILLEDPDVRVDAGLPQAFCMHVKKHKSSLSEPNSQLGRETVFITDSSQQG